ncbi:MULTISPECIES: hypothetical protein [Arthrobacter]|uniref:Uncharacterized protein n=1 Tax=Arthrobacter terricola TaxID=2547396 RepID=A0A4R5KFF7_9MICC|nr:MULTISPECIES: hypothetical protein [Arthrobacter]MBT8162401.1 hypothetical protein [Arthrobacter sp. GN70]TDF93348.1 hypothetical protein E1809_15990 [Arthrobacter terricola]
MSGFEGIESFIGWGLAKFTIIAMVSIPALPLSVAAALLLRPVRSQLVHVLVFGLAGFAACTPLIMAALFGEPTQPGVGIQLLTICAFTVTCAMGGRLLIWPLVRTLDAATSRLDRAQVENLSGYMLSTDAGSQSQAKKPGTVCDSTKN